MMTTFGSSDDDDDIGCDIDNDGVGGGDDDVGSDASMVMNVQFKFSKKNLESKLSATRQLSGTNLTIMVFVWKVKVIVWKVKVIVWKLEVIVWKVKVYHINF